MGCRFWNAGGIGAIVGLWLTARGTSEAGYTGTELEDGLLELDPGVGLFDDARNSYVGGGGIPEESSFVTHMTKGVFGL